MQKHEIFFHKNRGDAVSWKEIFAVLFIVIPSCFFIDFQYWLKWRKKKKLK